MKNKKLSIGIMVCLGLLLILSGCSSSKALTQEKQAILNNWILQTESGSDQMGCNVDKPLNITFSEKGVNGYSGCNNYFGPFKIGKKHRIQLGPLASTMMACVGEDCGKVEVGFIRKMDMANKYKMEGNHLYLYQDNELLLTFRKAQ